ncbi:MAG: hypothetical protein ABIJ09_20170, partial [Pseudomonadota bacterium]
MAVPQIHPKDTWSSLAMKVYGDALLGVRLAQANGVATSVLPAQVSGVQFPPVEVLDPDRLSGSQGPSPSAAAAFADDEASVVKEARYRMVMAMGGSGAMNEAPKSVTTREVKKIERKSREERIEEASQKHVDMAETLDAHDGQALVLDVKPTRRPRPEDREKKLSTKEDLAKRMAQSEGKDLILEVHAGARTEPEEDDVHLGDALAERDGKALILEVKATVRRKEKTVEEEKVQVGPTEARGERLSDRLEKLDGKAMILDVRASTRKEETEEQKQAKKKNKATEALFADLAERDGKELVLDLNVQVKDEVKHERLKEKRKLAKKRKRRSGHGSLIPKEWKAQGEVSADDVDDYLDELREQRSLDKELWGEDTGNETNPVARAAKATEHRSGRTQRATYGDRADDGQVRPQTEGFGAFDEIQHQAVRPAATGPRPVKQRPQEAAPVAPVPPVDEDEDLDTFDADVDLDDEDTGASTQPGVESTAPGVPVAQPLPAGMRLPPAPEAPPPAPPRAAPPPAPVPVAAPAAEPARREPPPPPP